MNSSMFTADSFTHLKIVVVSLIAATLVVGIGVTARVTNSSDGAMASATVLKVGKPMASAARDGIAIR